MAIKMIVISIITIVSATYNIGNINNSIDNNVEIDDNHNDKDNSYDNDNPNSNKNKQQ